MDWWKQFKPKTCNVSLKAGTKEELLHEIVDHLVKNKALPETLSSKATEALLEREQLASTGVGMNVSPY